MVEVGKPSAVEERDLRGEAQGRAVNSRARTDTTRKDPRPVNENIYRPNSIYKEPQNECYEH